MKRGRSDQKSVCVLFDFVFADQNPLVRESALASKAASGGLKAKHFGLKVKQRYNLCRESKSDDSLVGHVTMVKWYSSKILVL